MNYREYQNVRNETWRILLDCKIDRLPVDLNLICKSLGVRTASYGANRGLIEKKDLSAIVARSDGLSFFAGDTPVVLFNEACTPERVRFTVAHELGHIVLGHIIPVRITIANREPNPQDDPKEVAANQFAARLLAPACVLWGLDLHTAKEIAQVCRISKQAAAFRADRMHVLYTRNKFLSSPMERSLYQQFLPFIKG